MTEPPSSRDLRRTLLTAALCGLAFLAAFLLQRHAPLTFIYLVAEDWWGEYATAVAYLTACGLLLAAMSVAPPRRNPGHLLMAFGFFFIGMEEISWAQRLLGISTPHVVAQFNYQLEINVHNSIPFPFMQWFCVGVLAWMFALPLLSARSRRVAGWVAALGIPGVSLPQMPPFVLAVLVLLFDPFVEADEIGELMLALAFVAWAAGLYLEAEGQSDRRRISPLALSASVTMLIAGLTAVLVAFGSDRDIYRHAVRYSGVVSYPARGDHDQAAVLFRHMIDAPPNPIYEDALFEYGVLLKRIDHADADAVLSRFVQQRYRLNGDNDLHDEEHRRAGIVFRLLDEPGEAGRAFQRALERALQRLQQAPKESRSGPLYSIARTYLEMGDPGLALKYGREALEQAWDARDRLTIQAWIENVEPPTDP